MIEEIKPQTVNAWNRRQTINDRDRLVELLGNKLIKEIKKYKIRSFPSLVIDSLADHLIENGVIVPPCKVGDIVYAPFDYWSRNEIIPYQITNQTITQNKKLEWTKKYRAMVVKNGKTIDRQFNFSFDEIGKTVFLTREEAEKKLEEMRK